MPAAKHIQKFKIDFPIVKENMFMHPVETKICILETFYNFTKMSLHNKDYYKRKIIFFGLKIAVSYLSKLSIGRNGN